MSTGIVKSSRQRNPLAWGIVAVFCVVLGMGLLVPVYADEVATVLMRGMFLTNGWRINTLMPQCGPEFLHGVPWLHVPGALAYDVIYNASTPLGVRVRGLIIAFAWLGLTATIILNMIRSRALGTWALAAFVAVLGMGVLPLTLGMMRGEQMLLLLLSVFMGFPLLAGRWAGGGEQGRLALLCVLFCLATSLFFYTHPKTLFFIPLVLLSAVASFAPRSKAWCVVVSAFALGCAWQTLRFATAVTQCPDAPQMSAILASNTVSLGGVFSDPRAFLHELMANIELAPEAMLKHMWFANNYQSVWLAPVPGIAEWWLAIRVNEYIGDTVRLVYRLALVLPPVLVLGQLLLRRMPSRLLLWLCAIWIGLLAHAALFKAWNFYAASLVIPLAAWCVLLSFAALVDGRQIAHPARAGWVMAVLLAPLFVLFLTSAAVLGLRVLPPTVDAQRSGEIGLPQQPLSIPTVTYAAQRDRIRNFAEQCHIRGDGERRLVVDNLTFFAFDKLQEPLQSDYLNEQSFGADLKGDALPALLKRLGAKAVIARCTMFPSVFADRMRREGNLCCVDLSGTTDAAQ